MANNMYKLRTIVALALLLYILRYAITEIDSFELFYRNVLRNAIILGLPAIAAALLMRAGRIDLSAGGIIALSAGLFTIVAQDGAASLTATLLTPIMIAVICCLLVGAVSLFGRIHGLIFSLFITLTMREFYVALLDNNLIMLENSTLIDFIQSFGSLHWPYEYSVFSGFLAIALIIRFLLMPKECPMNYPVNLKKILHLLGLYAFLGLALGLSAIILAIRIRSAPFSVGINMEFDIIMALVIGGSFILGGKGGIINAIIGVLILSTITTLGNYMGTDVYHINLLKKCIFAVFLLWEGIIYMLERRRAAFIETMPSAENIPS